MQCVLIHIPMIPIPKARARVTSRGFSYTPKRSKDAEKAIQGYLRLQWPHKAISSPIEVDLVFGMPIPKSKKRLDDSPHVSRPDIDNLMKQVLDSANGIVWLDDAQVHTIKARKVYAREPFIAFTVSF